LKSKILLFMFSLFTVISLLPATMNPAYAASGALTSPPPTEVTTQTLFGPTYTYLDDGKAQIINNGSGNITVDGQTTATQYVDTIGIQLTIQRWTGSTWVDYIGGSNLTMVNEDMIYASWPQQVLTGYYYRIKSQHWTIQYGVKEQGERISPSYLVN
jgi:hypothetical protein